jgi:hypothetical protein
MAIDLRKAAEVGTAVDAAVITRDAEGQLDVRWSTQTPGELMELGAWLFTVAQHEMLQSHEIPEVVPECSGEDS